ncbi:MAG: cytochrome c3 family protein [Phycisphaerales bacterium]|nr:cytochrome c3 family protein [Phycisphaerales bacterium]
MVNATRPTPTRAPARSWRRVAIGLSLVAILLVGGVVARLALRRAPPPPAPGPAIVNVTTPAPRPTTVIEFKQGCVSAECHVAMARPALRHPAAGADTCNSCHGPDAGGHTYPMRGGGDAACTECHDHVHLGRVDHKALTDVGCGACHKIHGSGGPHLLKAASIRESCEACHPPQRGTHDHDPYATGRCVVCHEPHASDSPSLLTGGGGPDHCRLCHSGTVELTNTAPYSHARVGGACLACHAPHTGAAAGLMRDESRVVCISCHEEVAREVGGATVSHDAVLKGDQCSSCHEPHGSDIPSMLKADQTSVCLKCHAEPVRAADGRQVPAMAAIASTPQVHGPVAAGHCSACHNVHGGTQERLLKTLNLGAAADEVSLRNYALCFTCHDRELALSDRGEATRFRDGAVNLHRRHLLSDKGGRSCGNCHEFHGGDQPRLMADSVAFEGSSWSMPIGYFTTPDGGGCAPGCHEALRYSRAQAVNTPRGKDGEP